jgi:hypothetical protein
LAPALGARLRAFTASGKRTLRHARALRVAVYAVTVVLFLLAADTVAGFGYRTGTQSSLIVTARAPAPARAIVAFPGYAMPGRALSDAFTAALPNEFALIVVQYAQRGIDSDQIYQAIMGELRRIQPSELEIYGASMGGLCARDFLHRYQVDGAAFGRAILVLDTAPSGSARTKRPPPLYWIASWYRGGPLSSAVWAWFSALASGPPAEPGADPSAIAAARHDAAWIGVPALTSQATYLASAEPLGQAELAAVVKRATYLVGEGNVADDPVVAVDDSITDWRRALPGLTITTVKGRKARWHLPIIEWPRATLAAVLAA